jgi:hypothetical protein
MSVKCYRWPQNISSFSNLSHYKIYTNLDFWLENEPSGNPVKNEKRKKQKKIETVDREIKKSTNAKVMLTRSFKALTQFQSIIVVIVDIIKWRRALCA